MQRQSRKSIEKGSVVAYELIIFDKNIEVHYDLCDDLIDKKLDRIDGMEFVGFMNFEEVEEFLQKYKDFEVIMCDICKPHENREEYDEEYDDFYEEFSEDDDIDSTRCDIM